MQMIRLMNLYSYSFFLCWQFARPLKLFTEKVLARLVCLCERGVVIMVC